MLLSRVVWTVLAFLSYKDTEWESFLHSAEAADSFLSVHQLSVFYPLSSYHHEIALRASSLLFWNSLMSLLMSLWGPLHPLSPPPFLIYVKKFTGTVVPTSPQSAVSSDPTSLELHLDVASRIITFVSLFYFQLCWPISYLNIHCCKMPVPCGFIPERQGGSTTIHTAVCLGTE